MIALKKICQDLGRITTNRGRIHVRMGPSVTATLGGDPVDKASQSAAVSSGAGQSAVRSQAHGFCQTYIDRPSASSLRTSTQPADLGPLDRPQQVHRALAALAAHPQTSTGPFIDLPVELLTQSSVAVGARLLYGLLQLTPGFVHPTGSTTYAYLQARGGTDPKTVRRALHELVEAGWIIAQQPNQNRPIRFELRHPRLDQGVKELALVKHRLSWGQFRGESLMREYLSLLVDDAQFEDDAAPGFLVNPMINQRLQFDRYYPPRVAFEFNGPQHYVQTDRHPAPEVAEQRARDLMKKGICQEEGIELVVVHASHLSLKRMQAKVGTLLPLRHLSGLEPVVAHLEYESKRYRRSPSVHPPVRR